MVKIGDIIERSPETGDNATNYNTYIVEAIYPYMVSGINQIGFRRGFSIGELVMMGVMHSGEKLVPDNKLVNSRQ